MCNVQEEVRMWSLDMAELNARAERTPSAPLSHHRSRRFRRLSVNLVGCLVQALELFPTHHMCMLLAWIGRCAACLGLENRTFEPEAPHTTGQAMPILVFGRLAACIAWRE